MLVFSKFHCTIEIDPPGFLSSEKCVLLTSYCKNGKRTETYTKKLVFYTFRDIFCQFECTDSGGWKCYYQSFMNCRATTYAYFNSLLHFSLSVWLCESQVLRDENPGDNNWSNLQAEPCGWGQQNFAENKILANLQGWSHTWWCGVGDL